MNDKKGFYFSYWLKWFWNIAPEPVKDGTVGILPRLDNHNIKLYRAELCAESWLHNAGVPVCSLAENDYSVLARITPTIVGEDRFFKLPPVHTDFYDDTNYEIHLGLNEFNGLEIVNVSHMAVYFKAGLTIGSLGVVADTWSFRAYLILTGSYYE